LDLRNLPKKNVYHHTIELKAALWNHIENIIASEKRVFPNSNIGKNGDGNLGILNIHFG
jgi:hypothetical protein